MSPLRRLALALVPMLLVAGCLGTDEPEDLGAAKGADPGTPTVPAKSAEKQEPKEDAGKADKPADAAPSSGSDAAPAPVTTPISWDGKLAPGACLPAGPNACISPGGLPGGEERMKELDVPGNATKASLTVTWTPSSPATEQLRAVFILIKSCGDGCWEGRLVGDMVSGASPLVVESDVPAPEEGETLGIFVDQARLTPSPVYGYARVEQTFHVEGTVTSLA